MEEQGDDNNYRSSDDEDYDGAGSEDAEDAEDVAIVAPAKVKGTTGKRRRSTRHDDGLEEVDANEAADLKAAAQEVYGEAFLREAAAAQATSALTAARLDALWSDMNTDQQHRPRLTLVGGVPLSSCSGRGAAPAVNAGRAGVTADLAARGALAAADGLRPPARVRLAADRRVALEELLRGGGAEIGRGAAEDCCLAGGGAGSFGQEPLRRINLPPSQPHIQSLPRNLGSAGAGGRPLPLPREAVDPELASLRAAMRPAFPSDASASTHPMHQRREPGDPRLVAAVAAARAALAGKKLAITQTVKFAGQTMQVTKLVTAGTQAAQAAQERAQTLAARAVLAGGDSAAPAPLAAAPAATAASAAGPLPPPPAAAAAASAAAPAAVGLSVIVANLDKPEALSTLAKSSLDWDQFKHGEGIDEELERATKAGFVERQAFLSRVDERAFDIERAQRARDRSRADAAAAGARTG